MFRFIFYLILFYLLYIFFKNILLRSDESKRKIKNKGKHKSSFNIDKNDIEDAKFKDVKDEN